MPYDNTDRGALFRNDKRETEKHPTHTGTLDVKCPSCGDVTPFWLSAWTNVSKAGQKYFSLALTQKTGGGGTQQAPIMPDGSEDFDDDIPF
jgi:ribosomal protein S27E